MKNKIIQNSFVSSVASLLLAFVVGGIILLLAGHSPVEVYLALFSGAFGDQYAVANTLAKATPILFTGLAVAIAFRGGLFNIGGEGQLYLGALTAAVVGVYLNGLPSLIHIIIVLVVAGIVGAIWSSLAGYIKVKWNAHEVIVTIMLNYIAILLTDYLVNYPLKAEGMVPRTESIVAAAELPLLVPRTQLSIGFLIAIIACMFFYWFFKRTVYGYEIKALGLNPNAARTGGIFIKKQVILTMFISGFLCAMAGAVEVLGVHHYFIQGISPGYGFDGVAVAVLARNNPIAVIFAALLFGALRAGGMRLDRTTDVPSDFIILIQALVILFVATPWVIKKIKIRKGRGESIGSKHDRPDHFTTK